MGRFTIPDIKTSCKNRQKCLPSRRLFSNEKDILKNNINGGFSGGSDGKESVCNAGDPVLSLGQEDSLKKGMATHSSILTWRIPWTEKPDGLQFMESQRVGHD